MSVELTNTHLCLGSCADTDVWVGETWGVFTLGDTRK